MGKFHNRNDDNDETAIDMSPLIDCVFILLIFFIVTTVFVEESGLEVDKPESAASNPQDNENENVIIRIRQDGKIFANDKKIGMQGIYPIVRRQVDRDPEAPIVIQAERGSKARITVQVSGQVQAAGATKVTVTSIAPKG